MHPATCQPPHPHRALNPRFISIASTQPPHSCLHGDSNPDPQTDYSHQYCMYVRTRCGLRQSKNQKSRSTVSHARGGNDNDARMSIPLVQPAGGQWMITNAQGTFRSSDPGRTGRGKYLHRYHPLFRTLSRACISRANCHPIGLVRALSMCQSAEGQFVVQPGD
jgi:hypothetical protein